MPPTEPDPIGDVVAALQEAIARLTCVEHCALARAETFRQATQWIHAALLRLGRIEPVGDSVEYCERLRYAHELAMSARQEVEMLIAKAASGEPLTFVGYAKYLLSRAQGLARELDSTSRERTRDW